MRLNRKGFVFQVAYAFSQKKDEVDQVSLCQLFWRFTLGLFVLPIAIALALVIAMCYFSGGFLFGKRPGKPDTDEGDFVSIKRWPKIGGHQVWPLWIIISWLLVWIFQVMPQESKDFLWGELPLFFAWAEAFFLGILLIYGLLLLLVALTKEAWVAILAINFQASATEASELFWQWARAKKERFCPRIDIVD